MALIVILILIAIFIVILLVSYTRIYNRLVQLRNAMQNAWADVDVQLKRRFDLIPNMVEVAKKYMEHESEVLVGVTKARSGLADARESGEVAKRLNAENAMGSALAKFMVTVEEYPELKADAQMTDLMSELTATEDQISSARRRYNDAVRANNDGVQMFPANIVASMFDFEPGEFFEVTSPEEREAPKVSFS